MPQADVKSITAATGSFPALRLPAEKNAAGGNVQPEGGKLMPQKELTSPDMEMLAHKLNVASRSIGRELRFEVNMQTGRSVIQVLDRDTGEIIRQIPPENARTYVSSSGTVSLRLLDEQV
jgi:flagellar protein FlaG